MDFPDNAFGDPFDVHTLPLRRPGQGYAVQMLDTDTLLDRRCGSFLPIRSSLLDALFPDFTSAHAAAAAWVRQYCPAPDEHRLAIVPASFDPALERHVLIYGVLRHRP